MKNKRYLYFLAFLLCFGVLSCQQEYLFENNQSFEALTPKGKEFMLRLETFPDKNLKWEKIIRMGKILPDEVSLLYGGEYGLHYILPLLEENEVVGVVIFPLKGIDENGILEQGYLDDPIVSIGEEVAEDAVAGSFFSTASFDKWKEHGLKISRTLEEVRYRWGSEYIKKKFPMTRTWKGDTFVAFYRLEFENYIDENGNAVIVGMNPLDFRQLCYQEARKYLTGDMEIEVDDEYIYLACPENMMSFFLIQLKQFLRVEEHVNLVIIYVYGKTFSGEMEFYPERDDGGSGGGAPDDNIGNQEFGISLCAAIFVDKSNLSDAQWDKLEKALQNINNDCLGGKLIVKLLLKRIKVFYNPTISPEGSYNHEKRQITIKDFKEYETTDRIFERTLFHEMLHSVQSGDVQSKLNQEIEVRLAVYRYALKYEISLGGKHNPGISLLDYALDKNYNITDMDLYQYAYQLVIDELKKTEYKNYSESSSARDMNTLQELAEDC